ncbi:phenazine biosynthesis protein [Actibacterium mucosum KCTC 23349]|uniref:Phenazine biosynthesis protein n=1 Tax=Actibacterium mucosum KCTC 23349 TaxID=1454373 RepID=A0A037ZDF1_9RHOB|nr:PhzF family phenazine biosynthesis protein [Actibacterium mucosum]KAJ54172.1 phenazine biosynthesis protein [Actibacterium mucosum KCTC 23349]
MTELRFHVYDVFTDTPFAGNPLAIVEGAGGLRTAQMQTIAREFNLSETIFVIPPANPAHTAKVRIFFPTAEIPFAGHPTVGCAIHLAKAQNAGDFDTEITLEEEAGLVPVRVTCRGDEMRAEFAAPVLPSAFTGQADPALIAKALDISPGDLGPHQPGIWQGGPAFLYAPVRSREVLARVRAIEPHWSTLMDAANVDSAYIYAPTDGADWQARMFSPTAGIPEDPATGSASAILSAQLLANGALGEGRNSLQLLQGVEMGRRSEIGLTIDVSDERLTQIRVSGSAVPFSHGFLTPPAT